MKQPFFLPFKGIYFEEGLPEFNNKKVLIIGDSHYCGGCEECGIRGACSYEQMYACSKMTCDVIHRYELWRLGFIPDEDSKTRKWMNGNFKGTEIILTGKSPTPNDSVNFWEHVAFCNFVQSAASETPDNNNYSNEEYQMSEGLIWSVVLDLKPDIVITWGNRAYDHLRSINWHFHNNYSGYYECAEKKIWCVKINHPSRADRDEWHKKVQDVVDCNL